MTDGPAERPTLKVLITRCSDHQRSFAVIDLLAWPYYESRGWTWIGLDPETEAAWHDWRSWHPEAS